MQILKGRMHSELAVTQRFSQVHVLCAVSHQFTGLVTRLAYNLIHHPRERCGCILQQDCALVGNRLPSVTAPRGLLHADIVRKDASELALT